MSNWQEISDIQRNEGLKKVLKSYGVGLFFYKNAWRSFISSNTVCTRRDHLPLNFWKIANRKISFCKKLRVGGISKIRKKPLLLFSF